MPYELLTQNYSLDITNKQINIWFLITNSYNWSEQNFRSNP